MSIPFGPWHPDKSGLNSPICIVAMNCLPAINGYKPLKGPAAITGYLGVDYITDEVGAVITDEGGSPLTVTDASPASIPCIGAAVVFDDVGNVSTFAGTATDLYKLDASLNWLPVTRLSGGSYATGSGERWQFGFTGGLVVAVTISEDPQKYLLGTSTNFEALGGTPPRARYIATVGEFVVLGGLFQDERTVRWSGLANAEHWAPGTLNSDYQTFQNGGPVRGLVGGEVGYVFQAEAVTRMTFVPGSDLIFQFDQVEGGRGLIAPYSLMKLGSEAFYLSADGFYRFTLAGGASTPLGVGKWAQAFIADLQPGTEPIVLGGIDPTGKFLLWAYSSVGNPNTDLDRVLIYDWTLDEATTVELNVTALAQTLTTGITLDGLDPYGDLDSLPFSLDSPVWRGGASLLGLFLDDGRMSSFSGPNMSAQLTTADGGVDRRMVIKGIRPHVDTRSVTAAVAAREAEGDSISFAAAESMADNGVIPAWVSGFVARARYVTAEGAAWSKFVGAEAVDGPVGKR